VVPVSPQTEPTMWNMLGKPPLFHDQARSFALAAPHRIIEFVRNCAGPRLQPRVRCQL
jgi:hypothetical protein